MQRYFIPETNWKNNDILITGNDIHHIRHVMRKKIGDKVICNHINGKAAVCKIVHISDKMIQAQVKEWLNANAELPVYITIVQGIPKGDKLDFIIQKGTELGVNHITLFQADRSISKWDEKKRVKRMERYRRIMKEASEQCHRNRIPTIDAKMSLETFLTNSSAYDVKLFAYEGEAKTDSSSSLYDVLSKVKRGNRMYICIGPEGGFSDREIQLLKQYECAPVRLGPRILRTETASLYALASISYHFEEMRCH